MFLINEVVHSLILMNFRSILSFVLLEKLLAVPSKTAKTGLYEWIIVKVSSKCVGLQLFGVFRAQIKPWFSFNFCLLFKLAPVWEIKELASTRTEDKPTNIIWQTNTKAVLGELFTKILIWDPSKNMSTKYTRGAFQFGENVIQIWWNMIVIYPLPSSVL